MILGVIALTAAGWDLATRRIPNPLVLCGLLAGFALAVTHSGVAGLKASAIGLALAFALTFPQWMMRWMGGGDAKLFMVVGAFLGPGPMVDVLLWSTLLNGVVAIVMKGIDFVGRRMGRSLIEDLRVPMALAIFGGLVAALNMPLITPHLPQ